MPTRKPASFNAPFHASRHWVLPVFSSAARRAKKPSSFSDTAALVTVHSGHLRRPGPRPSRQRVAGTDERAPRASEKISEALDLDGCAGPQPLAGEQVTHIPVRGHGLKPVFESGHVFALSFKVFGAGAPSQMQRDQDVQPAPLGAGAGADLTRGAPEPRGRVSISGRWRHSWPVLPKGVAHAHRPYEPRSLPRPRHRPGSARRARHPRPPRPRRRPRAVRPGPARPSRERVASAETPRSATR